MAVNQSDRAAALWLEAYAQPIGYKLLTTDPVRAKTLLYNTRTRLRDRFPQLASMTIRTSPTNPALEVWIMHTGRDTV